MITAWWTRRWRGALLVAAVGLAWGGQRLWMNLRPDAPLPDGFVQYTPEAWAELQASGRPLLVDVYASWCPTCARQHEVLTELFRDPRYQAVTGIRVDFDRDGDFLGSHGVTRQSTVLVFAGGREVSRTVAATNPETIRRQLDEALAGEPFP